MKEKGERGGEGSGEKKVGKEERRRGGRKESKNEGREEGREIKRRKAKVLSSALRWKSKHLSPSAQHLASELTSLH